MSKNRIDRISHEYRRALADEMRALKDPRVAGGMVSITRCEVTGDLRYARVYVSVMGDRDAAGAALAGLQSAAAYLRRAVAQAVDLRAAPEPQFFLDDSIRRGSDIIAKLGRLTDTVAAEQAAAAREKEDASKGERDESDDD